MCKYGRHIDSVISVEMTGGYRIAEYSLAALENYRSMFPFKFIPKNTEIWVISEHPTNPGMSDYFISSLRLKNDWPVSLLNVYLLKGEFVLYIKFDEPIVCDFDIWHTPKIMGVGFVCLWEDVKDLLNK